jgi:hypothetical protein
MISARRAFEQQAAAKLELLARTAAAYVHHVAPQLPKAAVQARASACLAPYLTVDDETLSALELSSVRASALPPPARTWTRHAPEHTTKHSAKAVGKSVGKSVVKSVVKSVARPVVKSVGKEQGSVSSEIGAGDGQPATASRRRSKSKSRAARGKGPTADDERGVRASPLAAETLDEGAKDSGNARPAEADSRPAEAPAPTLEEVQYFFDQEDTADKDSAFVQWTSKDPDVVRVVCPVGTHLRRRRYIRVMGTALHLHMAGKREMRITFDPPQVNGVVALGCLGFFVRPIDAGTFVASLDWPRALMSPQDWQFRTVWHGTDFQSSYFDMIGAAFRWAWRESPFKSAITALKRDGALIVRPVDWTKVNVPAKTEMYGEYAVPGSDAPASFFGTVGDVANKRALLPPGSAGRAAIDAMRVYFLHPSKPAALAAFLNERASGVGPQLEASRDLDRLPETALANLAKIWTPHMLTLVRTLVTTTPTVTESIIRHVPLEVRDYVRPPSGPRAHDTDAAVLAIMKSIALYPDLAPKVLARAS